MSPATKTEPVFRFDDANGEHAYYLDDVRIPSITQLIERAGLLKGQDYYTEASRERGQEVHRLCADFDLGVLDVARLDSPFRGYVLAYEAACKALRPSWDAIEVADVHPGFRFAGRTDRLGTVLKRRTVGEIKSAAKTSHHAVQTALQAVLASARWPLPAEAWQRLTIYVKPSGKFTVEQHTDRRDLDVAMRLIKEFCR